MFKELFENKIVLDKKDLTSIIKREYKEDFNIIAFGTSGNTLSFDIVFHLGDKQDAEKFSADKFVTKISKILYQTAGISIGIDKKNKDWKNGVHIESEDWRKAGPKEAHDKYIAIWQVNA